MKIAIVTSHFTPCLADHTRITNGLDAIVVKSIPILLEAGHELHVICAGKIDDHWNQFVTAYSLEEKTVEEVEGRSARMQLTRGFYKKVKSKLLQIDPDFVWSHIPSPGTSADFALDYPTAHHTHEINQNAMYSIGRLKGMAAVIENGGNVYNSPFIERKTRELAEDFMTRMNINEFDLLKKPITSIYQCVNAPLDKIFLEQEIRDVKDYRPFMSGRYDPKFIAKNIHMIDALGIPLRAVVSGSHPKIFKQLEESKTATVLFNTTRQNTVDAMSTAPCHIMACLHESASIFNFEMLCFGSVPITIGYSDAEPHSAYGQSTRIHPDGIPKSIPVDDPDLTKRIKDNIEIIADLTFDERYEFAMKSRKALSHEAWYAEFLSMVPNKTSDTHRLDIA